MATDFPFLLDWPTALAPAPSLAQLGRARHRGLFARLWDRYRAWQAQRETVRQLYSLDSGTLRDLGISPREIESLVYGDGHDRIRQYQPDWWRK
jgi:uncharacterized protein YjiS (DUF1127 family)